MHAKFQQSNAGETFSNSGPNGVDKNVRFSTENWTYLRNGKQYGQGCY